MTNLKIAPGLTLPIEAVTETFAILAKRGVGKTHTASVMAEEMLRAGAQIVVLDPTDVWWGLRSSADGKTAGESIYVIGGNHADVPLEATAGTLLADLVVDTGVSIVLALRHLSKTKQRSFVAEFAERLYHRKGESGHQTPLHVFIDEADAFVPQGVKADVARAYGAIDDIVRRGRSSGLGVTLISQRSAVIAKDVLTQCEVLMALRTVSPQDRKALDAWVEAHDAHDQRGPFMDSIASLDVGEAWVWSPGWLDLFKRVKVRPRTTFDSSATPKAGERRVEPKRLADVDLDTLRARMAETVERAEANDPKRLHAEIAELRKKLAAAEQSRPEPIVERVEVPRFDLALVERLEVAMAPADRLLAEILAETRAHQHAARTVGAVSGSRTPAVDRAPAPRAVTTGPAASTRNVHGKVPSAPATGWPKLGRAERALLTVLVQHPEGRTRVQLSLLSGYSFKSSSFGNALGALRSAEYATKNGDPIQATSAGIEVLGDYEPLPSGDALYDWWRGRLGKAERSILTVLVDAWPQALSKDEISDRSGYSATSSSFGNALGKLRSLELVDGWAASDDFVESIRA